MSAQDIINKIKGDDMVNHPSHYTAGNIEVIDYILDQGFNYCLGNAVKYISRAGRKLYPGKTARESKIIDLQKAVYYLQREVISEHEEDTGDNS